MIRIIPRLDIKGPNLVKGIHLEGLRVLGKPEHFARYYYENGADELLYMDAVASLYNRNNLLHIVERTAKEVFIPLTVGGGLRSVEDIRAVLRAGADKVSLNTAALRRPELIREAAKAFGSSTIVISIEAIRQKDGTYRCYTDCGRQETGVDALEWAVQATELGAGEILVTSVDREGTGKGFDLELTRKIAEAVSVPVIACGGAGCLEHVYEVITQGKAQAVCIASLFHYHFVKQCPPDPKDFPEEGNLEFIRKRLEWNRIQAAALPELKEYLVGRGIDCRWN
ncbi:MAG: imidazole glycerol phosphate synthase cyclase subunit [Gemmatales bacterium]|nr:imidazole glycerol phosphate synthase cyclase subunit [Gemmatales bacterium]MCS7161310.1 imidazole glycerol phosphate synthase cyclase subunit [Gemmatales bacterium]MDW8176513.1 imidazole glycerol phosphate synthase cyclase subunit [Gemmatales bacterium]MDW8222614.1 imidazole glycerol phosphate synthase cyclase subunit [Gemmatales bacterium]